MINISNYNDKRIFVLNEPNAPRLNPALAREIGLNESIILLQLEYWISISSNFREGKYWTYQSATDFQEKVFPFWSKATINRAIKNLLDNGYLIEDNFNKKKYDKTRWFTLNYEKLANLTSIRINGVESRPAQNESPSNQNESHSNHNESRSTQNDTRSNQNEPTIPETTTENTTETTTSNKKSKSEKVPYTEIKELFNSTCKSLAQVRSLSSTRKTHIKARWDQFDKDIDAFIEAFKNLENSEFCKGNNDRRWKADFDWLIKNDSNMLKVLEGKYNKDLVNNQQEESNGQNNPYRKFKVIE